MPNRHAVFATKDVHFSFLFSYSRAERAQSKSGRFAEGPRRAVALYRGSAARSTKSCAILKRSSDPWCEIAILSQPRLLLFLTDFTLSATFQRIMVVPCLAYLLAKHTTTNVPLEKVTWLSGLVVGRADLTAFEIVGVGVDCRISACHHTFAKARRRQGKIHICTASIHHVSQLPEGNYSPAKEIRRKKAHMQGTESGHRKEKKPGTWDTCTSDYCKRLMKKEYTATCSRSQDLWKYWYDSCL